MFRRLKLHISPAMVVAMLALVVALAGTAVAGGVLNKKKVNNIITNRAPGLSVASAKNSDSAKSADSAKNVFGATTNDAGAVTQATLPGTTASKSSNTFTIHFPRSVTGCTVTGSGLFDGDTSALASGTANPNNVILSNPSGTSVSAVVVCP
jgi:hypothetical protein